MRAVVCLETTLLKFGKDSNKRANYLLDNGYSEELVNIFYEKKAGGWDFRNDHEIDSLEHEYMKNHDLPFMDGVRYNFIHRYDSIH